MEYFLGDNRIINLNSFLGHINYVYYLYTRPLQKKKMVSLLLINGTGFLLTSPRCSERSLKGNNKYIPVGLGTHRRAQIPHLAMLSHLVQWCSAAWENWPFFPTTKPHSYPQASITLRGTNPNDNFLWTEPCLRARLYWKGDCTLLRSLQMVRQHYASLPTASIRISNMLQFPGSGTSFMSKALHSTRMKIKIWNTVLRLKYQNIKIG